MKVETVRNFLISKAKKDMKVTYGELIIELGLPPFTESNWINHPLFKVLDVINKQDSEANRPFITSLIINKKNMVSYGFFKALDFYRHISLPKSNEARRDIWNREYNAVIEYYKDKKYK